MRARAAVPDADEVGPHQVGDVQAEGGPEPDDGQQRRACVDPATVPMRPGKIRPAAHAARSSAGMPTQPRRMRIHVIIFMRHYYNIISAS